MTKDTFNSLQKIVLDAHTKTRIPLNFPHFESVQNDSHPFAEILPVDEAFINRGVSYGSCLTTAVEYQQGKIVYYEKPNNHIGISFEFSGCAMAQFTFRDRKYIAHISLSKDNTYDCKESWNKFLTNIKALDQNRLFKDFIVFKPADDGILKYIKERGYDFSARYSVCGIIDTDPDNVAYTGLMDRRDCSLDKLYLGKSVKRVPSFSAFQYLELML